MDALLVTVALSACVMPTASVLPGFKVPNEQLTAAGVVQLPWLGMAARSVAAAAEKESVKFTCGTAVLPWLVIKI